MGAIVIGSGLFGQLIAKGLRVAGYDVTVLDNRQPMAGSPAAACLIRKEWCGKLPDGVFDAGMKFLGEHYQVEEKILFNLGAGGKKLSAFWVDPRDMLKPKSVDCTVTGLQRVGMNKPWGVDLVQDDLVIPRDTLGADLVVVAAGYWSQELVPWVDLGLTGRTGSAWLYPGLHQQPFIIPWAPYKQIVGFDRGDGYWVSDGSAIKPENWTAQRKSASFMRCALVGAAEMLVPKELTGIRPYTKESPCFCKQVAPGLWVATGARKNGTLLGAWCAQKIAKEST